MNFQELVDSFNIPTCILSVRKNDDGGCGEIRIAAGNKKFLAPIDPDVSTYQSEKFELPRVYYNINKFIPNSLYERYLPKNSEFEDICRRAAVQKMPVHSFVHMNEPCACFEVYSMPVDQDDGEICYCVYSALPCDPVKANNNRSNTAFEDVIQTCIKLQGTDDFTTTTEEIAHDIRILCRSDVCTIMAVDPSSSALSVLASSVNEKSKLKRIQPYTYFNEIISLWHDSFMGSDCLIINDENDWEYIRSTNFAWYQSFIEAGVTSFIMFPLCYDNEELGFICAFNYDTANTVRIRETLKLTTLFISSKLSSYIMMERLKKISFTDRLTGIPNRFAFENHIESLIKQGEQFVIVSIDINNFKIVNEIMGFEAGNKLLIEAAARWKAIADSMLMGTTDYIARIGGDEFALVMRGADSDTDIIENIRMYSASLETRMTVDNCDFYFTASFGYAVYPDDARTSDKLHAYADAAMLEVKRLNSSNHILRFNRDFLKASNTHEIERKLRTAVENDMIFCNLQPQYDIDHKLYGFEALARLRDADGNTISPGDFIPIAEKVGLIDKVDSIVFRKSAEFIGSLIKRTGIDICLSVNISVRHLMRNDFLSEVKEILSTSGLPTECLEIEITESIMIDSAEKALYCISQIHNMGIRIAIDDFGTGYSALSYLNTFPADTLKIDKSFIDQLSTSESSTQYVAAIISMGHIMGFEVISEGVEEEQQLETLRDIGCDYIQGYIWGRPMTLEEAEKLVSDM